ncbi:tripartite tricarboxylate transporter family receptor domain protein, partial [Bordetella bronchiseptica E012]|uniref:tripartite tricarboxylate transporter substrate-binding protein n=1 Tax=Bordetella bronchiseptica TaxID=518 RepID=UPI0004617342
MKPFRPLAAALLAAATLAAAGPARAQADNWPSKPITLIVPYAPGGFADTRVRLLARKLGESLRQTVVVENKAGAGGVIGTNLIAKAAPDGYTIGTGNLAPMAVNPTLMPAIPYDAQKDLAPVVLIENSPLVLSVHNTLPVKNLQDQGAGQLAPGHVGAHAAGQAGLLEGALHQHAVGHARADHDMGVGRQVGQRDLPALGQR